MESIPRMAATHPGVVGPFSCKEIVADLGGAEQCRGVVIPIGVNAEAGWSLRRAIARTFPARLTNCCFPWRGITPPQRFRTRACATNSTRKCGTRQARDELEMKWRNDSDLQRSEANLAEAQS